MLPTLGPMELLIIGVFGVLIFGKRLPEIGRSLGKGIIEFKKGIKGIESELESATRVDASPRKETYWAAPDTAAALEPSVPKFEPPVAQPIASPIDNVSHPMVG